MIITIITGHKRNGSYIFLLLIINLRRRQTQEARFEPLVPESSCLEIGPFHLLPEYPAGIYPVVPNHPRVFGACG